MANADVGYSILSSIISDTSEVNRFFDHISKIAYFREMPLFWLQWHMAMSAQSKWVKAEDYLNMGYAAATTLEKKRGEKYNRKQLDDRKAKFLAARAESNMRTDVDLFRDLKEAFDLVGRLMRDPELTHHPYETLLDIGKVLELRGRTVLDVQRKMLLAQFRGVAEQAKLKLNVVPEGSQRFRASEWLKQVESMIPGTR